MKVKTEKGEVEVIDYLFGNLYGGLEEWVANRDSLCKFVDILCEKGVLSAKDVARIAGNEVDSLEFVLDADKFTEDGEPLPF